MGSYIAISSFLTVFKYVEYGEYVDSPIRVLIVLGVVDEDMEYSFSFSSGIVQLEIEPNNQLLLSKVLLYPCLYHCSSLSAMLIVGMSFCTVLSCECVCASWTPFTVCMRAVVDISRLIMSMDVVYSSMMSIQIFSRGNSMPAGLSRTFIWTLMAVDVLC